MCDQGKSIRVRGGDAINIGGSLMIVTGGTHGIIKGTVARLIARSTFTDDQKLQWSSKTVQRVP